SLGQIASVEDQVGSSLPQIGQDRFQRGQVTVNVGNDRETHLKTRRVETRPLMPYSKGFWRFYMSASSNPSVRPDRILEMVWGYAPPIILGTAIQCKVFDLLDAGPKTVEELAKASGNSARGLRAILNALVGFHFLSKNSDGRYALTPESAAFLVSSKPGYLGKFAEFSGLKMIHTWLPLPEIVR